MARDNILDDSPEDWPRDAWAGSNKPAALALIMRTALRRDIPPIDSPFLFTIGYVKPGFESGTGVSQFRTLSALLQSISARGN